LLPNLEHPQQGKFLIWRERERERERDRDRERERGREREREITLGRRIGKKQLKC
jgi:hypothetical protein